MKFTRLNKLQRAWPDFAHIPSRTPGKQCNFLPNMPEVLKGLNVQEQEKILGICVSDYEMIKMIQNNGYSNVKAMEVTYASLGISKDFRNLPINEKFRVICFDQILDHMPGGIYSRQTNSTLQLLAEKIYLHLEPNGYFIFNDFAKNTPTFSNWVFKTGFQYNEDNDQPVHIFRKE